jgi:hypothetical protein
LGNKNCSLRSIEIYGEIGHLTRICPEKDYGILAKGADATLELPNLIEGRMGKN